jgi:hypothetical protein
MKKAQGLPISTIILAVLGLVILFILFSIVTGKLQLFGKGTQSATEPEICTKVVTIDKCDNPLIGNYIKGKDAKGNPIPIGYNEVCCA